MLGWLEDAWLRTGTSSAHGPHHDAQKLTTTGLPRSCWIPSLGPSSCWIASSGAAWPRSRGLVMAAGWSPHASDTTRTVPRTIAPNEINPDLTFNALSLDDDGEAVCRRPSGAAVTAGPGRVRHPLVV